LRKTEELVILPTLHPKGSTAELLRLIPGIEHYEERQLFNLFLLKCTRYRLIYVTSTPLDQDIVNYYFSILQTTGPYSTTEVEEWKSRLALVDTGQQSSQPLGDKVLSSPSTLPTIAKHLRTKEAGLVCVHTTGQEELIAQRLGLTFLSSKEELLEWGSKSGSRNAFVACDIPHARGTPKENTAYGLASQIANLWEDVRSIARENEHKITGRWTDFLPRRMVVKLTEGFSGEGNAILSLTNLWTLENSLLANETNSKATDGLTKDAIIKELLREFQTMRFQGSGENWESFQTKMNEVGAIAEMFLEGDDPNFTRSPSAQMFVDLDGSVYVMSTHEQILGGLDHQCYMGCVFPANEEYRLQLQTCARSVAKFLSNHGVVGHFSIDFMARFIVDEGDNTKIRSIIETQPSQPRDVPCTPSEISPSTGKWHIHALEINLRAGGTTHPMMTLRLLTEGRYDVNTGLFITQQGPRYYVASDNIRSPNYAGLTPGCIHRIFDSHRLGYDGARATGTVFHLLGCLKELGKLGLTSVGSSPQEAQTIFDETIAYLDAECLKYKTDTVARP